MCRLLTFEQITVRQFIDCVLTGERAVLVVEGEATPEQLEDAWLAIYSRYCDAMGNVQFIGVLSRSRQADVLASRLNRITHAVELARGLACDELADILKAEGFTLDIDAPEEQYHQQLDAIIARLLPDRMRLEGLQQQQPEANGKGPTEQDFRDTLFEIGKFQGYAAPDTMLLIDYCTALRKLQEHIKHITQSQHNGRRNA